MKDLTDRQIYWKLFTITLLLSATTFGGGFVIISMMQKKYVDQLKWLSEDEVLDMTAIAQSSPGPLGVNMAIVVGYRLKRFWGAVVCTLGAIIPPLVIISILSVFYNQFRDQAYIAAALQMMRAGVAAVVCDVVINLAGNVIKTKKALWIGMMCLAFLAVAFFNVSAIVIILVCGGIGLISVVAQERRDRSHDLS